MGFSLLLTGFIFLFSPDISLFDLLPDFIGWSFITLGLLKLADIEMRLEDAKILSRRMLLISIVKLVLSLFTFKFSSSDSMLATFSYGIVEIITVFPFIKNLFVGLDYVAMRVGAPLNSDKLNMAKWYLYVFFPIKNLLAFLPSAVAFFDSSVTGDYSANTWFINFEAAMRMLMVFSFFLSCVIMVVMLSFFIPLFVNMAKNQPLNEKLTALRQETVLSVESVMIKKNSGFVLSALLVSIILFFDFYIDGIDVLPSFIGFAGVAISSIFAQKKMGEKTSALTTISVIGFIVSLTAFIYRLIPLIKNKFVIDYNFSNYTLTLPLSAGTFICTVLCFIFIFRVAGTLNEKYARYKLEDNLLLYKIGGVVMSAFNFVLYALPNLNTTFVFPSLIFGTAFTSLGAIYLSKLKKQI